MFNVYNFFSAHCFFILSNDSGSWVKTWRLSQPGRVNGQCVGVPFDKVLGVGTSGSNRVYIYNIIIYYNILYIYYIIYIYIYIYI